MTQWICLVCGWIYDEAKGATQEGIAPGTKWQDIPDDWACPDCGVGKEDFEMVELKTPVTAQNTIMQTPVPPQIDPIIIIGSGLAGYNLAKEIRKLDKLIPLMIISRDDGNLYYKPNLSSGLTHGKTPDDLILSSAADIETELSLTLRSYTEVTQVNSAEKSIHIGKNKLSYSKLVIATGAKATRPHFDGNAASDLHCVNDLLDYRNYRSALAGASKVLIIGAGLIGCEFTNDLLNHGMEVTIIEAGQRAMSSLLPEDASRALEKSLTEQGARFHFDAKITKIDKHDGPYLVTLENKVEHKADLIVSAIGLKANSTLAQMAGLKTEQGITVNRYLETSTSNIYALGDVANAEGQNFMYVEPLLIGAKALARTLTGDRTALHYKTMAVTVKTPACPVVIAPPAPHSKGQWDISKEGNNVEALFRNEEGDITGFALTGAAVKFKKDLEKSLPVLL
jgi:rubredoxin-NAD+ reductase